MNLLEIPDDILIHIFSHIKDTTSNGSLRQTCQKIYDMLPPSVFKNGMRKYTLEFDWRDITIYDKYNNQVGTIKTLFPGYTKYNLRDIDTHYTRIYTPIRIVKIEKNFKKHSTILKTLTIDLRNGNKRESVVCQTMNHEDIGGLGCQIS